MNISLKVEGQSIEVDSVLQLASDTVSQVDCSVQLSAEWSDFDLVKCVWENQHIADRYVSTITNGTTEVPQEVLTERGSVRVNLVGYDVTGTTITERLTTYKIQVIVVKQKVNITGTNSASPTAAEWEQQLTAHTGNATVHVTAQNKSDWNAKLEDAPSDNKSYARKNGEWSEVTGGGSTAWNDITGKPETFPPSTHNHDDLYYGKSDVYTKSETDTAISNHHDSTKAQASHTHTKSQISDFAHNHDDRYYTETEVNALLDEKADEEDLPTKTSDLTNDSGFLTEHQSLAAYRTAAAQDVIDSEKADADDIPTKTSDLTNDSGFLTEHQSLAAYRTSAAQDVIDDAIEADIDAIEEKIPSQATSSNQLADKSFVNSSIGTNTAYYISNNGEPFASVAQLQAYSGTVTNNDYAFVTGIDAQGNTYFDRYKATVVGTVVSWAKEYRLNNSSFTAAQWAAISSGITSGKVATYDGYAAQIAAKYTKPASGIPESDLASGVQTTLSNSASHIANRQNPHSVTKAQVGLGNVRNIELFMNTQPTHVPDEEVLAYIVDNTEGVKYTIPQGTYSIPSGGIPSTDMTSAVQTSLGKADTALQSVPATYRTAAAQDVIDGGKEVLSNKVTSISSASTDTQYPTAKCLYDMCGNIETLLAALL